MQVRLKRVCLITSFTRKACLQKSRNNRLKSVRFNAKILYWIDAQRVGSEIQAEKPGVQSRQKRADVTDDAACDEIARGNVMHTSHGSGA